MPSVTAGHARAGNANVNVNRKNSDVVDANRVRPGILRPSSYTSKQVEAPLSISPNSVMYGVSPHDNVPSRLDVSQVEVRRPVLNSSKPFTRLNNTGNTKKVSFNEKPLVHTVEKYIGVEVVENEFDQQKHSERLDQIEKTMKTLKEVDSALVATSQRHDVDLVGLVSDVAKQLGRATLISAATGMAIHLTSWLLSKFKK
jgi:hypothetical protein